MNFTVDLLRCKYDDVELKHAPNRMCAVCPKCYAVYSYAEVQK